MKPLPTIPPFDENKVTPRAVTDAARDDGPKSPVVASVKPASFSYMFADADETEVTTIQGDDNDSIGESSHLSLCQLTLDKLISLTSS
jgi:hypothetical protein